MNEDRRHQATANGGQSKPRPDPADATTLAVAHRRAGRLPKAEVVCREALKTAPENPDLLNLLGLVLLDQRRPDEAAASFERAVAAKPDHVEAHYYLGNALLGLGRLDAAADSYRRAIAANPTLAEAHNNLGSVCERLGRVDAAAECYRRAAALKPDYAPAHYNLGNVLQNLRQFEAAADSYRRAITISPNVAELHNNLGTALAWLGRHEAAIDSLERALALRPDYAPAHYNMGNALRDLGRLEATIACYQRAFDLDPALADPKLAFYSVPTETPPAAFPGPAGPARDGAEMQRPFDVAVIIPTVLRPTLKRAVESVFRQAFAGSIQILIGVDKALGDRATLDEIRASAPPNRAVTVLDLGYSTSARHGGLHPSGCGGALRTMLSYAANSRYLAYLDDDNWWDERHVASLWAAIQGFDWAFSLRWFVDAETDRPLCVDEWESVGPAGGVFAPRLGGFVDTNCLMIDKLACEPVLRCWNIPADRVGGNWGLADDRVIFRELMGRHSVAWTRLATAYYVISPKDLLYAERQVRIERRLKIAAGPAPGAQDP